MLSHVCNTVTVPPHSLFCPAGAFAATSGLSTCTLCPVSTYGGSVNATSCTACPLGTYHGLTGKTDVTDCVNCKAGFFCPGSSVPEMVIPNVNDTAIASALALYLSAASCNKQNCGTTWSNAASRANNSAVLINAPVQTLSESGAFGFYTFSGNGVDQYVATTQQYLMPAVYTVSVWFSTILASGTKIIGFENSRTGTGSSGCSHQFYIGQFDGILNFAFRSSSFTTVYLSSGTVVTDGVWRYATATFDGTVLALYINGVQMASTNVVLVPSSVRFFGWWRLGAHVRDSDAPYMVSGYFSGRIALAQVHHNMALTATQVQQNYALLFQSTAISCPTGTFSLVGATACQACPAGSYCQWSNERYEVSFDVASACVSSRQYFPVLGERERERHDLRTLLCWWSHKNFRQGYQLN
jgi:hypothetical protein